MLLKADYELSSKEGKCLEISNGVYIHDIIASDTSQKGPGLAAIPSCGSVMSGASALVSTAPKPVGNAAGMPDMEAWAMDTTFSEEEMVQAAIVAQQEQSQHPAMSSKP